MPNKVLVSIIIPVYNVAAFLEETIQSVLNQSLKDLEIILVNDGSTDHSALICKEYLTKDTRISFFDQPNSGVSIARNNGLRYAKGEYVFFMDSDDTLDPEFIKTSYDLAKKQNSDIVIIGEYYCKRMPNATALPTCAQLIRLAFLNQYPDVRFPEKIQPCEDGLFSHQLLAVTTNVASNPDGIYHYRQHENQNHTHINKDCWKVLHQIPKWFEILDHFYTKYNLFESHALHLALFMEHEPFEFRYLGMPLDEEQKSFLYDLIKKIMFKKVLPNLSENDKKLIGEPFLNFISSDNFSEFDAFYIEYSKKIEAKKKRYLFMIQFIPLKSLRRKLIKKISDQY